MPLVYPAGDLAEVDFFEVLVELAGAMVKVWMFVMRLMHSGRDFAWLYTRQDQTSFLDGHVRAFAHFGCVPQRIAYDNLKAAVAKTLVGSERVLACALRGAVVALPVRSVLLPSADRPRQGRRRIARQGDPLAAPGADSARRRPRGHALGAASPPRR